MIVFEDWITKPFLKVNQETESTINLAKLYWQGLDPDLSFSLENRMRFDMWNKLSFLLNRP